MEYTYINTVHHPVLVKDGQNGVSDVMLAGGFLILGALISAGAAHLTMRHQLKHSTKAAADQRFFDERILAYTDLFSMISKAHMDRGVGKHFPSNDSENEELNKVLARASLLAGLGLTEKMRAMFNHLVSPIPLKKEANDEDRRKGTILWQELLMQMRIDIGAGEIPGLLPNRETERKG